VGDSLTQPCDRPPTGNGQVVVAAQAVANNLRGVICKRHMDFVGARTARDLDLVGRVGAKGFAELI